MNVNTYKPVNVLIVIVLESIKEFLIIWVGSFLLSQVDVGLARVLTEIEKRGELKSISQLLVQECREVKDNSLAMEDKHIWKLGQDLRLSEVD